MIEIIIDEEKCTGCGECVRVCPKGPRIYRIVNRKGRDIVQAADRSFCTGCTTCIAVCTPKAIRLQRNW